MLPLSGGSGKCVAFDDRGFKQQQSPQIASWTSPLFRRYLSDRDFMKGTYNLTHYITETFKAHIAEKITNLLNECLELCNKVLNEIDKIKLV